MWNMLWPICLVVLSNTVYNICAKSTPESANAFLSLGMTYIVAAAASLAIYFVFYHHQSLASDLKQLNWASFTLGLSVVALEFAYICIYRAGWKVSTASLTANIALSCVLLLVGVFWYKEAISAKQIIGMLVSAAGLILICK